MGVPPARANPGLKISKKVKKLRRIPQYPGPPALAQTGIE